MKEDIQLLANAYFDGKITLEEETILFHFISRNEFNKRIFHEWEKQWILNKEKDTTIKNEWNLLQNKIQTRNAITPIIKVGRISFFRKIASVAAIILITMASTIFTYNLFLPSPDTKLFIVEAPIGEKSRITLPDGTLVWLNSSSKITYNSLFGNSVREVKLEGEAYFEVTSQHKIPFRVKTYGYDVVVKGTKFNVSSYHEDSKSATTLMEGKVEIIYQDEVLEMNPGELIQMDAETHEFLKSEVNSEQYKSWVDNKIEYDAITLNELLKRLSRQHDVNISFDPVQMESKVLNISIKNEESIDEILKGISNVIPITISKKNQDINVKLK